MKKLSALLIVLVIGVSLLTFTPKASAQLNVQVCPVAAENSNFSSLCAFTLDGNLVSALLTTAFIIATLLALAFLVFGGIKWITSGGDKANVEAARNMIVAALVGLVIAFLAYFILAFVLGFFGITITDNTFTLPSITSG